MYHIPSECTIDKCGSLQHNNTKLKNHCSFSAKVHLVNPPSANVAYMEEKETNKYKVQNQNLEVQGLFNLQNLSPSAYAITTDMYKVTFHRTTLS